MFGTALRSFTNHRAFPLLTSTTLGMSSSSPKTTTPGAARTSLISWTQAAPLADFDKARWGSRRRPKGDLKDSVEAGVAVVDMVGWDGCVGGGVVVVVTNMQ